MKRGSRWAVAAVALVIGSCGSDPRPAADRSPELESFEAVVETTAGGALNATVATVASDVFADLNPILGRFFEAADTSVAVLSHEFWQRLGGEAEIVGAQLVVDGARRTVIGVVPAEAPQSEDAEVFVLRP